MTDCSFALLGIRGIDPGMAAVIAASIGGLCTILVALIARLKAPTFKRTTRNQNYRDLAGLWIGKATPLLQDSVSEYTIELSITAGPLLISGDGVLSGEKPTFTIPITFEGQFFDERFAKIDYRHKDQNKHGYGSMIFKVDNATRNLDGRCAGRGLIFDAPVFGTINLATQ